METRGRKTKLTDDMIEAIYTALKNRMSWNQIASIVGVDPKTLHNWRHRGSQEGRTKRGDKIYRAFVDTIQRAESELQEVVLFQASNTKSQRIFICFIQGETTRRIHIGETQELPHQRLSALQLNSPDTLKLLKGINAGRGDEAQLHQQFAKDRVHGEWFYPSQPLLKFIESLDGN